MKHIIFYLLPFLSFVSYSQNLKGYIIDKESRQPISFAEIFTKDAKFQSEENGEFLIHLSIKGDSLKVRCLGYEQLNVFINSPDTKLIIELTPKPIALKEIESGKNKPKKITLGSQLLTESRFSYSGSFSDSEIALFVKNPDSAYLYYIDSVSIYIPKSSQKRAGPFRLKIYDVYNGLPHDNLLEKNLIITPKGSGWQKIPLDIYNIQIPPEGFFVSAELLYGYKKKFFYKVRNISTGEMTLRYASEVGLSKEFNNVMSYIINQEGKWQKKELRFPPIDNSIFNPMIRVNLSKYEK